MCAFYRSILSPYPLSYIPIYTLKCAKSSLSCQNLFWIVNGQCGLTEVYRQETCPGRAAKGSTCSWSLSCCSGWCYLPRCLATSPTSSPPSAPPGRSSRVSSRYHSLADTFIYLFSEPSILNWSLFVIKYVLFYCIIYVH